MLAIAVHDLLVAESVFQKGVDHFPGTEQRINPAIAEVIKTQWYWAESGKNQTGRTMCFVDPCS